MRIYEHVCDCRWWCFCREWIFRFPSKHRMTVSHYFVADFFLKTCVYNRLADLRSYVDFFFLHRDLNLIICNYVTSVRNKNVLSLYIQWLLLYVLLLYYYYYYWLLYTYRFIQLPTEKLTTMSYWIKQNLECNYSCPIDLASNVILHAYETVNIWNKLALHF